MCHVSPGLELRKTTCISKSLLSRWYILYYHTDTQILPKGGCFVQRVDGGVEERSNLIIMVHMLGLYTT